MRAKRATATPRQQQRTLHGNVSDFPCSRLSNGDEQRWHKRQQVGKASRASLEHQERQTALGDVLLVLHAAINGDENLDSGIARGAKEDTVLHAGPPECLDGDGVDPDQM